jgi:hypothetical protein
MKDPIPFIVAFGFIISGMLSMIALKLWAGKQDRNGRIILIISEIAGISLMLCGNVLLIFAIRSYYFG